MESKYSLFIIDKKNNEYLELDIEASESDMLSIFSIENIQDITTQKDNVTRDITLKGTKNNNIAFGNLYDISRYSSEDYVTDLQHNFKANQMIACVLLENNIQIIEGNLLIKTIEVNEGNIKYTCAIIGNVGSFFGDLSSRNLDELDSLKEQINYDMAYIRESWTGEKKYIIPMVDYGVDERVGNDVDWWDNKYDFKNFRPSFFVKSYIDAIFRGFRFNSNTDKYTQLDESGNKINKYSYTSDFINTPQFQSIFIPYNGESLTSNVTGEWSYLTLDNTIVTPNSAKIPTFLMWQKDHNMNNLNTNYFGTYHKIEWEYYKQDGQTQIFEDVVIFRTLDKNVKTKISINADITLPRGYKGTFYFGLCELNPLINNEKPTISNMKHYYKINKTQTDTPQTYQVRYVSDIVNVAGDFILALIREESSVNDLNVNTNLEILNARVGFSVENQTSNLPVLTNQSLNVFDCIPKDIKCIDFLKSILTMFNLYLTVDPDTINGYKIEPYNTFYKDVINLNTTKAIDWTDKLDNKNYTLETNLNLPKKYTFKYAEDSDMMNDYYKNSYNKGYGAFEILDRKGTAEEKQTELIFAPTININHSKNNKKLPVVYKSEFLKGQKTPIKSKLRLLYNNGLKEGGDIYNIHFRGSSYQNWRDWNYCSMFYLNPNTDIITDTLLFDLPLEFYTTDDITDNYDIMLYNKYHSQQLTSLLDDNIMVMNCKVNLNESDINNIDFSVPIFIQTRYGNSYFKLLEVEYANSSVFSNVRLQRIITP